MTARERKRVTIVTGASRGLGRVIALRFSKAGDRVVVNYKTRRREAADVVEEMLSSGSEAFAFRADVGIDSEVDAMVQDTVKRWGMLDVLINNAGITRDALVLRMSEKAWDDVMTTNLKGTFHCIRAASRIMSEQRSGHIISVSSIVGMQGREGQANYSASKAGILGLTEACAGELGRFDVKVNAVLPGYLPTDMRVALSPAMEDRILRENVLQRGNDPKEVAEFVYRLSCMNNVSGQIFNLDSRIL
jgi:3-oxoacyl-[acyl-carrier protein] reductase